MTDVQLFEKVLGFLQQTIAYSNEEMSRLDELKRWVRERLSQPEPRPIAWLSKCYNDDNEQIGYTLWDRDVGEGCFPVYAIDMSEKHVQESDKDRHGFEQPDLAKVGEVGVWGHQREWVGLTDEDIDLYAFDEGVTDNKAPAWLVTYARGIEAKLKEKNLKNALEPQTPVKESFHKEWVGLDPEMMRNTPIEFNRGALWAERYLKEKNNG